jgi:hypothetical protein
VVDRLVVGKVSAGRRIDGRLIRHQD